MTTLAYAKVLSSGPCTLFSDLGRYGFQDLGVSPAGAADLHAHCWANHLLGNPVTATTLECSIGGLSLRFLHSATIVICGADMRCTINHQAQPLWQSLHIQAGDQLNLAPGRSGLRCYVAITQGWITTACLNSTSSCLSQSLGPQALTQHQELAYYPHQTKNIAASPTNYIPDYNKTLVLHLIASYQFSEFSQDSIQQLCSQTYLIDKDSNRMGLRLNGSIPLTSPAQSHSEGISLGSVQVPPNGQPIILGCERQTIGGYPKLGCIARLDLYQLQQRRPGQKVRFKLTNWSSQRQRWLQFNQFFGLTAKG